MRIASPPISAPSACRPASADVPGWTEGAAAILDAMMQDKKVTRGRLNLILARGIGRSFVAPDVQVEAVRGFLDDELVKD